MFGIDLKDSLSLGWWYGQYPTVIDGLVYLVLFTGLAHTALGRRFHGRAGSALSATVGVALALGATTLASRAGFTLDKLGPLAWLVLLLVLALVLYELGRVVGIARWPAAAGAVVVLAAGFSATDAGHLLAGVELLGVAQLMGLVSLAALAYSIGARWFGSVVRATTSSHISRLSSSGEGYGMPPTEWQPLVQQATVAMQIDGLLVAVSQHGIESATGLAMRSLAHTPRLIVASYKRAIKLLANPGYREDRPTNSALTEAMAAAHENVSDFERTLRLGDDAALAGNTGVLLECLGVMRDLERRSGEIVAVLDEASTRHREGVSRGRE